MRRDAELPPDGDHGAHTLRVWDGTVVGKNRQDVFVELGPRMQGVISAGEFETEPAPGEVYRFTLRGQEEGLWVLQLADSKSLTTWESMEVGSLVQARVVRPKHGGLELKVGPLHAFMPKSQTGLPREQNSDVLVGKTITCEVLEVDPERQSCVLSRKLVLQRVRESRNRDLDNLKLGQVVQGRVSRIEPFGVFVRFGRGMEGMIHVSDLSIERVEDPATIVSLGGHIEAKVLSIRQGGRRISLGLKQMQESPWKDVERSHYFGQVVEGAVTRVTDYGAFVAIRRGVEGLVHNSETGYTEKRARDVLEAGRKLSVRIIDFDCEAERMSLSLLHKNGARIATEEAADARAFQELVEGSEAGHVETNLGDVLRRALREGEERD